MQMVELLLDKGVDCRSKHGLTALMTAAKGGPRELLTRRGADLEAQGVLGSTTLHLAATYSDTKMVRLLLDCGARVDCLRKNGATSLMIAASRGVEMVELLVERGADLNARDSLGSGPLHYATKLSAQAVNLLLDKGIEVDCVRGDKATALMIAAHCGKTDGRAANTSRRRSECKR